MAKRKEGRPLPETSQMKLWREEFEKMSLEEHGKKLKQLGLDEEEIKEFNEEFKQPKKKKS